VARLWAEPDCFRRAGILAVDVVCLLVTWARESATAPHRYAGAFVMLGYGSAESGGCDRLRWAHRADDWFRDVVYQLRNLLNDISTVIFHRVELWPTGRRLIRR